MKKLTVIVKPANREDVIDIMESCAVYGVMETDITGYGNQKGHPYVTVMKNCLPRSSPNSKCLHW